MSARTRAAASGEVLSTMSNRSNYPAGGPDPRDDRYRADDGHAGFDEDPLVELARIVSEGNAKYRPVALVDPAEVDEPEAPRGSYDARRDLIDHEAWARDLEAGLSDDFGGYAPEPAYREEPAADAGYSEEGYFEDTYGGDPQGAGHEPQAYVDDTYEPQVQDLQAPTLHEPYAPQPVHAQHDPYEPVAYADEGRAGPDDFDARQYGGAYGAEAYPGEETPLDPAFDPRSAEAEPALPADAYGEQLGAPAGYAEELAAEPYAEPYRDEARFDEADLGAPTRDPYEGQVPMQSAFGAPADFDSDFDATPTRQRALADDLSASLEDELLGAMGAGRPQASAPVQPQADPYPADPRYPAQASGYAEEPAFEDEQLDDLLLEDDRMLAAPVHGSHASAYADQGFDEAVDDIFQNDPEAPPPPGGYDLDEVAQAMREGDPQLGGHGVLPPHSQGGEEAAPEQKSRRGLYAAAAVLGLVVLGGGAFAVMDFSDEASGPPPVITSDGEPMKVYPEGQEPTANGQSKLIYDRVGGVETPRDERLVLQEETPVASLPPAPDTTGTSQSNVPAGPRRVRTVVVRPDGTIISSDEPVTSGQETQPDAAAQPGAVTAPADLRAPGTDAAPRVVSTDAGQQPVVPAAGQNAGQTAQQVADAARQVSTTAIVPDGGPAAQAPGDVSAATATLSTTGSDAPANVPRIKPGDIDTLASSAAPPPAINRQATPASSSPAPLDLTAQAGRAQNTQSAPAAPVQTASAPAASSASIPSGAYIVQVSSQRTQEQAQTAFNDLQRRYGSVLGSVSPVIQRADLGDRGTFYRVRIPAGSREDAISLCERLKSAGGDCFVRRN